MDDLDPSFPVPVRDSVPGACSGFDQPLPTESVGERSAPALVDERKSKRGRWSRKYDQNRRFQSIWLAKFDWLRYDAEKDMMYCQPCRLLHGCGLGMGTRKFRIDSLTDHERPSKDGKPSKHQQAYEKWHSGIGQPDFPLPPAMILPDTTPPEFMQTLGREDLKRAGLFKCVYHLISTGRGLDEIDKMLGFLRFMQSQVPVDETLSIAEAWEMAGVLKSVLLEDLARDIKGGGPFSLVLDDSITCGGVAYCSLAIRFFKQGKFPIEMLVQFSKMPSGTVGEGLMEWILSGLQNAGLCFDDLKACVGLGSLGSQWGARTKSMVATQLMSRCSPFVWNVHGLSHRYNILPLGALEVNSVRGLELLMQTMSATICRFPAEAFPLGIKDVLASNASLGAFSPHDMSWLSVVGCNAQFYADYPSMLHIFRDLRGQFLEADVIYSGLLAVETLLASAILHPLIEQLELLCESFRSEQRTISGMVKCLKETTKMIQAAYLGNSDGLSTPPEEASPRGGSGMPSISCPFGSKYELLVSCDGASPLRFCAHGTTRALLLISGDAHWLSSAGQVVGEEEFRLAREGVEQQMACLAKRVLLDLADRFPAPELLEAFCVLDPHYWQSNPSEGDIHKHVGVLKERYGRSAMTTECNVVNPLIVEGDLDGELPHLKVMIEQQGCRGEGSERQTTKGCEIANFWHSTFRNNSFSQLIPNFACLAKVFLVLPLGGVWNERLFGDVRFLRKSFSVGLEDEHLNTGAVVMCNGPNYKNFPYSLAVKSWNAKLNSAPPSTTN
ncbi:hypothetical protein BSKO_13342 [Bryopsis sp. KO-2023]|nr:hypothetical protein BSKO_13342 [Bryopsis sp. KO-2023]